MEDRFTYGLNPEKLGAVSSYLCDPNTAPAEFLLVKSQYLAETGRAVSRGALFFQIRQAFLPGEVTAEEANRIGYETAMRWTKGKHQFFVCTHTDKAHIHNHIYLEMTLNVDELEILSIKEGQTVTITADAISDRTFTGVVTSVSAAGTTTGGTTTYPVTIRIDDTGDLLPGMNATAEIEVSSASNALAVPNGSVVRGNYVLVTKDSPSAANAVQDMTAPDGYVYVKITTGTSDNDSIEVTGGLQEGDTIAYDANAAEKQNASDSMEFMVGPGGTIAYDADAAEKQNASGSGGHGGGNGGPGGGGPGGGF